jgi:hypothetical protein
MLEKNTSPTIFIRVNTLLPAGLALESEAFLPGWRAVTKLDGRELGREIAHAKWNYFFLAGAMKTTVLGHKGLPALRRAVNRVLAKHQNQNFNSLEITKITSRRLLGVPYLSIAAHFRHIQESMYLVSVQDFRLQDDADRASAPLPTIAFGSADEVPQENTAPEPQVAVDSNS